MIARFRELSAGMTLGQVFLELLGGICAMIGIPALLWLYAVAFGVQP